MSTKFVTGIELVTLNCSCGGTYAINEAYRAEKEKTGGNWVCPYCKGVWGYGHDNENSRLKKQVAEAEKERLRLIESRALQIRDRDEARAEAEHFRKSRDGMKGQLVKTKKAIANGVCPCCQRYFKDLHRHMLGQHPDYEEQKEP